jgi:ATP-dependent DNA ligase
MLIERMRKRLAAERASFIEPCLPSPADKPPSGSNWIHEIKHDGFRLMDPVGIRLITRRGNDCRLALEGVARLLSPCTGPWVCALKSDRECRDIQKGGPT